MENCTGATLTEEDISTNKSSTQKALIMWELPKKHQMAMTLEGAPPAGNPAVYPAGTPRAGYRLFKITPAGTDTKVKDNEKLIQNTGNIKYWCAGRKK